MTTSAVVRAINRRGRLVIPAFIVVLILGTLAVAPRVSYEGKGATHIPDCNDPDHTDIACLEPTKALIQKAHDEGYPYYIGHAEPTTEWFSTTPLSGNNMRWKFSLPATEPVPTQNGSDVANFELYVALWMGLDLCDPNSNPFGSCVPNSDSNNPATAGSAFLELQFYPPGLTCTNTSKWCARLHINTLQNNTAFQVANCLEPTTQAFVTTDGTPGGPQLTMNDGDDIVATVHDTASGLETDVTDLTTGKTGTMVASAANGFVHNANLTDCTTAPFTFHPMFATASPGNVVPWASLAPNVAFDFEIGHFELCGNLSCSILPDGADADDTGCGPVDGTGIGGCFGSDLDHDGTPYLPDWPDGSAAHPSSLILGSPNGLGVGPLSTSVNTTPNYKDSYNTIKFQTTEATNGAFYPFWSVADPSSSCVFNFGNDIPGVTTNDFGQAAQYGISITNPCLQQINLNPNPVAIGPVCPGSTGSAQLEVANTGFDNLIVTGITKTGGSPDISLLPGPTFPVNLSPDANFNFTFSCTPTGSPGLETATFNIASNDPTNPLTPVTVNCTAGSGSVLLTGSGVFGSTICAGPNRPTQTIKVDNVGTCNLHLINAFPTCADFTLVNPPTFPVAISPDSGIDLTVQFTPTSAGLKACALEVVTDDPVNPVEFLPLTATTPTGPTELTFPASLTFPPTVVQQSAACSASLGVPVVNSGSCPVTIASVTLNHLSATPADYSLTGVPGVPLNLGPSEELGAGNLDVVFAPFTLARASTGTVDVEFENDPITHTLTTVSVPFCGEATHRGIRVLVTQGGVPVSKVKRIFLQTANGPEQNGGIFQLPRTIKNALLQTVTGAPPCPSFQFHGEFGGESNPFQLKDGTYRIKVQIKVGKKTKTKIVRVNIDQCTFTQDVVVAFP